MSTALLDNLSVEVTALDDAGAGNLESLINESNDFLQELKSIESSLESQIEDEKAEVDVCDFKSLEKSTDSWYKKSIANLKGYNSQINRFQKNILTNSKYNIDLDDSYPFPLNLHSFPIKAANKKLESGKEGTMEYIKLENETELLKAIIIHLLKIGQCDIVKDLVSDMFPNDEVVIEEPLLVKFKLLNQIVDDITIRHDLTKVLDWFKDKYNEKVDNSSGISQFGPGLGVTNYDEIEFKFHILQFILLLNGDGRNSCFSLDSALEAYIYSKENFPRFSKEYVHEIGPLMTLLLFKTDQSDDDDYTKKHVMSLLNELSVKMKQTFEVYREKKRKKGSESMFLTEILSGFENIHEKQHLFVNLSNEFISEYCKNMKLSNDSSLFQAILAGFINLPSFQKYSFLQKKLGKNRTSISLDSSTGHDFSSNGNNSDTGATLNGTSTAANGGAAAGLNVEAPYNYDLPFSLPDSSRFLFKHHPIFICPVSKEQLIPLTPTSMSPSEAEHIRKKTKKGSLEPASSTLMHNPVVVFDHCQHVALKYSIWQLSKRGVDNFKCHYCYKKHQFSEVSEAYFIDL